MSTLLKAAAVLIVILAQSARAGVRPVVFIPGILGSKLCEGDKVVWGNLDSLTNLARLDVRKGGSLEPCGLVESIRILGPFWVVHQYDTLLSTLETLGYSVRQRTLFLFPYDWRQSNFANAQKLAAFIDSQPELRKQRFDIVAHSMGGLMTRIYLTRYKGSARARKVLYLGTPFYGSMNSLAMLSDGWGEFKNAIAGGMDTIRETILSFPSIYELMPTYPRCCRWSGKGNTDTFDVLDADLWQANHWLPDSYSSGAGLQAVREGFARARDMRGIADAKLEAGVQEIRIVGNAIDTKLQLLVPGDQRGWTHWQFIPRGGDGTVPAWSAARNLSSLAGTIPSFADHEVLFDDTTAREILKRDLLDEPIPVAGQVPVILTKDGPRQVDLATVIVSRRVLPPGESANIFVTLDFDRTVARGEIVLTASLKGPGPDVPVTLRETDSPDSANQLRFAGSFSAPLQEEIWQVEVTIPGVGAFSTYILVAAQ